MFEKMNAHAIYWQILILRLSTNIFDSILREFLKYHLKFLNKNIESEKIPEDGVKDCGRKPWYQKLSIDGAGIHFLKL